ncbi:hypothetical protein ACFL02_10445, partial [Planctomycetota bacterium]
MSEQDTDVATRRQPVREAVASLASTCNRHPVAFLVAFCAVYTIVSMLVFARIGLLSHLEQVTFSTPDSKGYQ